MSETLDQAEIEAALVCAETGVGRLVGVGLERCSDSDILRLWRRLEVLTRMLASVDHGVFGQAACRHLAWMHGAKSITVLARDVLRISAGEAHQRAKAAEACAPRVAMDGQPLAPVFAHVAAAQAAGTISARHARIIVTTIEKLPERVPVAADFARRARSATGPRTWPSVGQSTGFAADAGGAGNE